MAKNMVCSECHELVVQPNAIADIRDYIGDGNPVVRIRFECDHCKHELAVTSLSVLLDGWKFWIHPMDYADANTFPNIVILNDGIGRPWWDN